MPTFSSPVDSSALFYRHYVPDDVAFRPDSDRTSNITLVFLHGWPMNSGMFEHLFIPLCESHGFQIIAPDRRGFGKSEWNSPLTKSPIDYNVFAADVVGLLESVDVGRFVFIGASMGAAESVLAYFGSSLIQDRCLGFIWLGPSMPYPLQTLEHPESPSRELWDSILDGLRSDRPNYVHQALPGIFAMQVGNVVNNKTLEHYERIIASADGVAIEKTATIVIMKPMESEIRTLAQNRKIPILMIHGDSDQGMPREASVDHLTKLLPRAELKIYENAGHGLYLTHAGQLTADILGFIRSIDGAHD